MDVGKPAPDFELDGYYPESGDVRKVSSRGMGGKWTILCFYPADFTFVCPTELKDLQGVYGDLKKLGAEVFGISTDTVFTHKSWIETEKTISDVRFPLLSDRTGNVSREYGVYNEATGNSKRGLFIIDPDGILKAAYITDDPVGRSAREVLRMLQAFKFVRESNGQVCPASWEPGGRTLKPGIAAAGKVHEQLK